MIKPPANVLELPLFERATLAMEAAVAGVIEEHIRERRPMYIWRDDKVVAIPPEELPPFLNALVSKRANYPE
jgi:hypothetical protein